MPKTELHLHLEGAVAATTFAELATKHGVDIGNSDPADLYQFDSLVDFLTTYTLVCHSIRDRDDFQRVTYECLASCAQSGARYIELFFSPESHLEIGVDYPTMIDGVIAGVEQAGSEFGLVAQIVPAINRELGPERAVEFVQMLLDNPRPEVIGVGLDFNEDGYPPELFVEAFALAKAHGLRRTSHAGEVGPAVNVATGIDLLDCERIDHGYHIVDDADLVSTMAERQTVFTVCPTTTTYTTVFRDLAAPDHAIRRMADGGLKMMINSDDPTMMGSDLAGEYIKVHDTMGFSLDEIKAFALNGLDGAWIDDTTRATWRADWSSEIDTLFADID